MPLSRAEAQDVLHDVMRTERSSTRLYRYRHVSPHLFLWGAIWAVGYGASYANPGWAVAWPGLALLGGIGSFWTGWKTKPATCSGYDWRFAAIAVAIVAFVIAVFAVMQPRDPAQVSAFFPILVAFFYALMGIWARGARLIIAGVLIAALTLGGYFFLPQYFQLWMAIVGGGALILGGFWLRSV